MIQQGDYFTIATWPSGMRLVRPVTRRALIATGTTWIESVMEGQKVVLALISISGEPAMTFSVEKGEFASDDYHGGISRSRKGYLPMSAEEQGGGIWIINNLLGLGVENPSQLINDIVLLPFPEIHASNGPLAGLIRKTQTARDKNTTGKLLANISSQGSRSGVETPEMIRWRFDLDGWDFYATFKPSLKASSAPVWSINEAEASREVTASYRSGNSFNVPDLPLPQERNVPLGLIGRSTEGIYEALRDAGLLILGSDYPNWRKERSLPGNFNDVLVSYALLGLPHPFLMRQNEFVRWLEGLEQ